MNELGLFLAGADVIEKAVNYIDAENAWNEAPDTETGLELEMASREKYGLLEGAVENYLVACEARKIELEADRTVSEFCSLIGKLDGLIRDLPRDAFGVNSVRGDRYQWYVRDEILFDIQEIHRKANGNGVDGIGQV
jgi:hypothetical protein